MPVTPSPRDHPNAFAGFSTAALMTFLVSEAKLRLGIDLTIQEAGYIIAGVTALVLFLGRKRREGG